jgi:formylglycine-generating enzyme
MLPEKYHWIVREFEPEGNPWLLFEIARELEAGGNLEGAATVYDRAFGLDPTATEIQQARVRILDQLAIFEHGICFRYIPGGSFLMGCDQGEPDERPWHPVWLSPYWMSETPISWAAYCRLMDWEPAPNGFPREGLEAGADGFNRLAFHLHETNKLRLQYCEDRTLHARDWHAHTPALGERVFGTPPRDDPEAPWEYERKPMIAASWQEARELAERLSNSEVRYCLPSEAQWEKAARGGLIGARYAWGNSQPTSDICDFDRFYDFAIQQMRKFSPNGYGLYAVNGCVWEWTRDWYDCDFYRHSPETDPEGPSEGEQKVLRGGSWADCADVVTVTFRMSRGSRSWRDGEWGDQLSPNIGFRLCRMTVSS